MWKHVLEILVCYVIGILISALVFSPYLEEMTIVVPIGGVFLALPELAITIIIFLVFRRSILKHLLPWCIAAPFLITIVWLALEWTDDYSSRGYNVFEYLSLRNARERAALAFSSASFASALFWYWNYRASDFAINNDD
jgi:hypothetical protein